jgi:hypothetical protein
VLKVCTRPLAVPCAFVATIRKTYVVAGISPWIVRSTVLAVVPLPAPALAVFDPYDAFRPYWK